MGLYLFDGAVVFGTMLAAATIVFATLGDVSESLIKRDLGIKDMSSLVPGHGGVLDRLDSLLLTAPVAFVVMEIMLNLRCFRGDGDYASSSRVTPTMIEFS